MEYNFVYFLLMKVYFSNALSVAIPEVNSSMKREIGTYHDAEYDEYQYGIRSWDDMTLLETSKEMTSEDDDDVYPVEHSYSVQLLTIIDRWGQNIRVREAYCLGRLYLPGSVLTACHCLMEPRLPNEEKPTKLFHPEDIELCAGKEGASDEFENEYSQFRKAKELMVHPWCFTNEVFTQYDLGLVKLDRPFVIVPGAVEIVPIIYYESVDFVCKYFINNMQCLTEGWVDEDIESSEKMHKTEAALETSKWFGAMIYEFSKNEQNEPHNFYQDVHFCVRGLDDSLPVLEGDNGTQSICSSNRTTNNKILAVQNLVPGNENPDPSTKSMIRYSRMSVFGSDFDSDSYALCLSHKSSSLVAAMVIIQAVVNISF